ncbi:hypothetical protein D3C87_337330 [compost metagenome]
MQSLPMNHLMLKFNFEKLSDVFITRFIQELGMSKAEEIFEKVNSSNKVLSYLNEVGKNSYRPTYKGIISTLNTLPYFIFCKGETLCIAALTVLLNWQHQFDEDMIILSEDEITEVAADIINYCHSIKLDKRSSMFTRFFDDLLKITLKEESDKHLLLMLSQMKQSKEYFENVPKKLIFYLKNVQVNTPESGSDCEYKAVCEDGSIIKFYDSTMDACVEKIEGVEGGYRVIQGTKVGEYGVLIPKENPFWT